MNNHFAYKADIKKLEKQISSNKNFKFNIKDKNNLFPASNNFSTDNNSEHIYKIINTSLKLFSNKCYSECSDLCLSLLKKKVKQKTIFVLLGLSLCYQGKNEEGIKFLKNGLKLYPNDLELISNIANQFKKVNNKQNAIRYYLKAIKIDKLFIPAYINLSEIYNSINQFEDAKKVCLKISKINNPSYKIYCNLGNANFGLGQFNEAISNYNRGLELNPRLSSLFHNKALCYMKLGNFKKSISIFEFGFKENILKNTSMIDYGLCLFESGELNKSLEIYSQCEELMPDKFELLNNLGNLYSNIGEYEKAINYFEKANELYPQNSNLIFNIALNFFNNIMYDEAIKHCLLSIKIDPYNFHSYNLLGSSYQNKDMIKEAIYSFETCIKINPNYKTAFFNYGVLCLKHGRISNSLILLQKAKDLGCDYPELNYYMSTAKYNNINGIDENLKEFINIFDTNSGKPQFLSSYYLPILYSDSFSNKQLFELHQKFDQSNKIIKVNKNNNNKLRIGYLSADFTGHSVGYFIEPVLENHNTENFEIFLYFNSNKPDYKTKIIQSYGHHWRDIFGKSDDFVYDLIQKDKIDILVDLSGHTAGNRLNVFRKKPSYKQISWIGYPFTTGLKTIDYKFTDNITDPIGKTEKIHVEKLYRIADCFLCYKNENEVHINSKKPIENNKYVTFGSFNNILKISKKQLDIWINILKLVPNSHLVLKSIQYSSNEVLNNIYAIFKKNNIETSRIKLLPMIPSVHGHLAMYNLIDISLDTSPFNGATTTFESLWMGVPVVTMTGNKHLSRVGTSILKNLNLNELIAVDNKDYINKIIGLSKKIDQLKYYQKNLRNIMKSSLLCDSNSFTKKIEEAYTKIYSEN